MKIGHIYIIVLYNTLHLEKTLKWFLIMQINEYNVIYKFFHLNYINWHISVKAWTNFQVFMVALSAMKLSLCTSTKK